mgnify:FL=1
MNGATSGYIVLVPVQEVRSLNDVTDALRAREASLAAKVAGGSASPEDLAALEAVRRLLAEDGQRRDGNGQQGPDEEPPMLLRLPEAARLLGLSLTSVRELVARRELPCVRIGASVRIRRDELTAWVAGLSPDGNGGGW